MAIQVSPCCGAEIFEHIVERRDGQEPTDHPEHRAKRFCSACMAPIPCPRCSGNHPVELG